MHIVANLNHDAYFGPDGVHGDGKDRSFLRPNPTVSLINGANQNGRSEAGKQED